MATRHVTYQHEGGHVITVQVGPPGRTVFTVAMDTEILRVANSFASAGAIGVPKSAWAEAVALTDLFGDLSPAQVQSRYQTLREAKDRAGESFASLQIGPEGYTHTPTIPKIKTVPRTTLVEPVETGHKRKRGYT